MQQQVQQTFKQFLLNSKQQFQQIQQKQFNNTQNYQYLCLVYGNESADLDSCLGSSVLAYYLSTQNQKTLYIPIINCLSQDITSRFEFSYFMNKNNINLQESFIYKNNIIIPEILEITKNINLNLNICLYDHNKPALDLIPYKQYVTQIVDHHADETEQVFQKGQIKDCDIRLIGSATSILSLYFKKHSDQLFIKQFLENSQAIVQGIHGCILLDTYNFAKNLKGDRWTNEDIEAFEYISQYYQNKPEDKEVILELQNLKFNVKMNQDLGTQGLCRKDYKSFQYQLGEYGYAAITINPIQFFEIQNCVSEVKDFIKTNKLAAFFLLFVYPSYQEQGKYEREFILLSENNKIIQSVEKTLFSQLKLEKKNYSQYLNPQFTDNQQLSILDSTSTYSRKIIEPIIRNIKYE